MAWNDIVGYVLIFGFVCWIHHCVTNNVNENLEEFEHERFKYWK